MPEQVDAVALQEDAELRRRIEAVLMVVEEPVSAHQLAVTVGADQGAVSQALHALADDYNGVGEYPARGFELRELNAGWRVYARAEYGQTVEQFVRQENTSKLSQAALESLAVVAYLQPVTRSRVAQIRGVNSDSVIRTLANRGIIVEEGQDPATTAVLYSTSGEFLEMLGLNSLDELPKLSPHLPGLSDLDDIAELVPGE